MSPAAKKATKKKVDWIAASKADDRASPRPLKDEEKHLPPGSSFLHEEIHGGNGVPRVIVSVTVPVSTRKENFSVPAELEREIHEATFGVKSGIALVALADYTVDRWEAMAPGTYSILPDVEGEGDSAKWVCRFTKKRGDQLQVILDRPLAYGTNRGNQDRRKTIAVPSDVRGRIEKLIPKDIKASGYPRFTGVVLGLAKWALDDIRRRGIQLHIRKP